MAPCRGAEGMIMKISMLMAAAAASAFLASPVLAEEEHDDEHPELFGAAKAFHDVLSGDWHAEPGLERTTTTCGHVGDYIEIAEKVTQQPKPSHADAEAWSMTADGMLDASVALKAYCATAMEANVASGLSTVHDRFHDLMKLLKAPE